MDRGRVECMHVHMCVYGNTYVNRSKGVSKCVWDECTMYMYMYDDATMHDDGGGTFGGGGG